MINVVHSSELAFRQDASRRVQRLIHASTVGAKEGFAMGIVEYTADEFGEPDLHQDQEGLFVIEGHGIARLREEEHELSPGDCLFVPAGTPHRIVRQGATPIRLVFARSGLHSAKG